jgi:hypothetical protein
VAESTVSKQLGAYLLVNVVVVAAGCYEIATQPQADWQSAFFKEHGSALGMTDVSLLVFPRLALGLYGFETGVSIMPLVRGDADDPERPEGDIGIPAICS